MAIAVQTNTQWTGYPYINLQEYKNAPTAIDIDNLVVGGNAAAQDAELQAVINRASSWIDVHLNQTLVARNIQETKRTRITPQGNITIHPDNGPFISLNALSWGPTPNTITAVTDPSQAWLEPTQFIYPIMQTGLTYSSQGPLSFGFPPNTGSQIYVSYNYTSGYANSGCTGTAGQTQVTVDKALGIYPGLEATIYDGSRTENVVVASTYVYGSTTVPLTSALQYSHTDGPSGAVISSLPDAIKQAAILVTTDFLKVRGDNSLTMAVTTRASSGPSVQSIIGSDLALAKILLQPFRRVY